MELVINFDLNTQKSRETLIQWIQEKRILLNNEDFSGIKVELDLSECKFFDPSNIVLIACFVEEIIVKHGIDVTFIEPRETKAREYLDNIRFFEYWNKGFNRKRHTVTKKASTLCLWQICPEMVDSYANEAKKHATNNWLSDKDTSPIHITIAELFNNVIDHSNCQENAYCLIQYYPKISKLSISVGDFGVGLAQKIVDYQGAENVLERDAVKLAFDKGFSTKSSPRNRGLGLDNVKSIADGLSGVIRLYCNGVSYNYYARSGREYIGVLERSFNGTLFQLDIDTKQLEQGFFDELEEVFDLL